MKKNKPKMLSGQLWRNTHQQSVDAILGAGVRKVRSEGDSFYNKDKWVAREFAAAMCEWAELNPGLMPSRQDITHWVARANSGYVHDPGIVIAATPDELPVGTAYALVGGAYHEAWHTEFSRRRTLHINEVVGPVQDLWDMIPYDPDEGLNSWQGLTGILLQWGNLIEDIRIERRGCEKYPGAVERMGSLQDLILAQEAASRQKAVEHGMPVDGMQTIVMSTFRDVGLGYTTERQKLALMEYETRNKPAYDFVVEGPLRPLMDESINLGPKDGLGHLWVAMKTLAEIVNQAAKPPEPEEDGEDGEGDSQEGGGDSGEPGQSGQGGGSQNGPKVWKVGDRAQIKAGEHAGKEVEVTRASIPDREGNQTLSYALVVTP